MMAILLRGPSGCGKTRHADQLKVEAEKVGYSFARMSADDFFMGWSAFKMGVEGQGFSHMEYQFDPMRLSEAHQDCFRRFQEALAAKTDVVVVDNTFIRTWEWENYALAAKGAGYQVDVVEWRVETVVEMKLLAARNVHKVPAAVVAKMVMEFEPCDGAMRMKVEVAA
jgi:hypothetical protein